MVGGVGTGRLEPGNCILYGAFSDQREPKQFPGLAHDENFSFHAVRRRRQDCMFPELAVRGVRERRSPLALPSPSSVWIAMIASSGGNIAHHYSKQKQRKIQNLN